MIFEKILNSNMLFRSCTDQGTLNAMRQDDNLFNRFKKMKCSSADGTKALQ